VKLPPQRTDEKIEPKCIKRGLIKDIKIRTMRLVNEQNKNRRRN